MPILPLLALALCAQDLEPALVARMPDAARLAAIHELLASEPHVAGTPGDARTIERIAAEFRRMGAGIEGFEVEVQEFFPLLARPVKARLEIVGVEPAKPGERRGVVALGVTEPNLAVDAQTAHPDLDIAWNAWSGSGIAEAGVVYVNYGRREDFARLRELGVDPRGRIALARYGGNFRGYKAKFAEEAGCAGLVIFTDPGDSGTAKGKTWPDGGSWANAECVQRGSLITLPYVGDPLTPGRMASKDADRLPVAEVALPRIPVQPIGYGAAQQIFMRMKGTAAPKEWQGGMPCTYVVDDPSLTLRLEVEQRREVMRTANVIARLRGATLPDEQVVVGSHHDAWCFGAADPLAGTICTVESCRNFCELARAGVRADRTVVFCAWGAEEYGIFGSSEFVEGAFRDQDAAARTVAYVNLDMAAMGLKPGGAVSPTLRASVTRALASAPGPRGEGSALDAWSTSKDGAPSYGDLGGGSDHVAFWCHAGIPSVSLSAGGSEGTSYHSNYDTVAWYRGAVGVDYAAAQLVTGMTSALLAEFADGSSQHSSATQLVADSIVQSERLSRFAAERGLATAGIDAVTEVLRSCVAPAAVVDAAGRGDASLREPWMSEEGLRGRPWFHNLYAATDRYSGYATSSWPLIREALEDAVPGDPGSIEAVRSAAARYLKIAQDLRLRLDVLGRVEGTDQR